MGVGKISAEATELGFIRQEPAINVDSISVIIPTKNEAENLQEVLPSLQRIAQRSPLPMDIVVVDGGSRDNSVAIAQALGAQVQVETRGRAQQMNRGASVAQGNILLFLHADTRLPETFADIVRATLAPSGVVAGAFDLSIEGQGLGLRWVEWGVQLRSHLFQMPYGDQALFLRRSAFEALRGFADLPIMEDFELVQRLKQRGRVAIAPAAVTTSARRWRRVGVLKTTVVNQLMIAGFFLGVPSDRLARWYRGR